MQSDYLPFLAANTVVKSGLTFTKLSVILIINGGDNIYTIWHSYGFTIGKILQAMETCINEKLKVFNITNRQLGLLLVVHENRGITQKEAGTLLQIDRTTMVKLVDELETLNYLQRKPKMGDRRAYELVLTKGSKTLLNKAVTCIVECEHAVLQNLSPQQEEGIEAMYKIIRDKGEKQ